MYIQPLNLLNKQATARNIGTTAQNEMSLFLCDNCGFASKLDWQHKSQNNKNST